MKHINRKSNYEKFPTIKMEGYNDSIFSGYDAISNRINNNEFKVIVIDCYPGVSEELLGKIEKGINPDRILNSDDIFYDGLTLTEMMQSHLTEDRVRGVMYYGFLRDFVDKKKLEAYRSIVKNNQDETILIRGVGASLIAKGDILVYADMARWEIQKRYRNGMPNFKQENYDEEPLKKYKRGFFIEWRIADKHKRELYDLADFWIDANNDSTPIMIDANTFAACMDQSVSQPFRLVPYFDPGVWGGQWMKEVCGLDKSEQNFAWSFDGVPEENSVLFDFGGKIVEFPAMNITLSRPQAFLGQTVLDRFGAEFPIRFDLLDTVGGQNLSLQVHPTVDFIRRQYGMPYTQEESYYILDAAEEAKVYLGVKDNVDKNAMVSDLYRASRGEISFPAEQYINIVDAKPHDHFLIPPGTIHCSGKDSLVLEISSSAYIFTFKLWDWDRVDLNGVPRPIHLKEGEAVIDYDINKTFADEALINQFEIIESKEGHTWEKTGLHPREYIETHRHTFDKPITLETHGNVRMLNLIEGESMMLVSPTIAFEPFEIHYAETFIIPANVSHVTLVPNKGNKIMVLEAFTRDYK